MVCCRGLRVEFAKLLDSYDYIHFRYTTYVLQFCCSLDILHYQCISVSVIKLAVYENIEKEHNRTVRMKNMYSNVSA